MLNRLIVLTLSLFFAGFAAGQSQQAIRDQLFGAVDASKQAAEAVHAAILGPTAYAEAMKLYTSAGDVLAKGKDLDRVREETAEAKGLFDKATEAAKLAQVTFADTLTARAAAEKAEAAKYAARDWQKAEAAMVEAATELEDGNMNRAKKTAADVIEDYREIEADAINARAKAGG
jgi:Fe-S cluster assembly ATPase SufC